MDQDLAKVKLLVLAVLMSCCSEALVGSLRVLIMRRDTPIVLRLKVGKENQDSLIYPSELC